MRRSSERLVCGLLALGLASLLVGCGGSATKRQARRLQRCDTVPGAPVDEEQARCIAGLYGVKHSKGCPMQVDRPEGYGQPAFRVLESCNGLGVVVAEASGRILAVVSGDRVLHD